MNTLNLNLNKNILNNYKYKRSKYDGSKTVRNQMISFSSSGGYEKGTSAQYDLVQKHETNAQVHEPIKIKNCAVNKNEYNSGKSPSNVSFGGLSSNKLFKTILEKSEENSTLCSATAMLLACCLLRPLSIMTSKNVEKENKMIASAKSIASGIIGFVLMFLVSVPIAKAVKKINKNPEKYLDKKAIERLLDGDVKNVKNAKKYNIATRFFKGGADMITAAPKGSLTIILIPPLLNVIFKKKRKKQKLDELLPTNILLQKTPHVDDAEEFAQQRHYVFFKGEDKVKNNVSFKGGAVAKMYDNFAEKLAKLFGKALNTDWVQNVAEKLQKTSVESHIMAISGTIVSTFYVINTKVSKKIEEARKEPLIYNSVISWALANIGAYSIDGVLNKHIKKFENHYRQVNKNDLNLDKQIRGLSIVKSALIFGMMYRWVTPWVSTILAEKVWNKKLQKRAQKANNV